MVSDFEKRIDQIKLINREKETLKLEDIDKYKISISKLQRNIDDLNIQNNDVMELTSKLRWREAAISNMKDRYEKCKGLSDDRNAKLKNLKRCLQLSHLKCDDLLIESRDREYKLTYLTMGNKEFEAAVLWSSSQLDIVQRSIACRD